MEPCLDLKGGQLALFADASRNGEHGRIFVGQHSWNLLVAPQLLATGEQVGHAPEVKQTTSLICCGTILPELVHCCCHVHVWLELLRQRVPKRRGDGQPPLRAARHQ